MQERKTILTLEKKRKGKHNKEKTNGQSSTQDKRKINTQTDTGNDNLYFLLALLVDM